MLELELTESLIMQDVEQAVATMQELQELGVQLSIDDFGTGYSSLSALKTFPVARLKIDKSFIIDLSDDENDRAVASAVISLGQKLNLRVIAEGVETDDQLAISAREQLRRDAGLSLQQADPGARDRGIAQSDSAINPLRRTSPRASMDAPDVAPRRQGLGRDTGDIETIWFSPAPVWFDNATGRAPLPGHRRVERVAAGQACVDGWQHRDRLLMPVDDPPAFGRSRFP